MQNKMYVKFTQIHHKINAMRYNCSIHKIIINFQGVSMKKLMVLALLSTVSFNAMAVELITKFQVKISHTKVNGKVQTLGKIRTFIQHETDITIFNPRAAEICDIKIGKADILGLGLEAEEHKCLATKEFVVVDQTALQDMIDRSIILNPFTSSDLFSRVSDMFRNGRVTLVSQNGEELSQLRRLISTLFTRADVPRVINLKQPTIYQISDSSDVEKITLEITPVSRKFAEQ
jgi:hypothetical protein